ncbi:hypothetical protein HDK77DRAFT_463994 [Phyllosticta capitalensis]|uniref:Mitochondrial outer membrane protein OM14 C-terminal domain-containing protein n=1 Tax=Phyllosticta capitalensis TaxID=121624 RepID=A0ABR1Y9C5_9PEZI
MSYADVAASGPRQSPSERKRRRAPPVPQVHNTDDSTHSLVDVDTPHVASVPSDWESQSVKTETQAERLEREAKIKELAKAKEEKAKAKAKKAARGLRENADHPVVIGNAVTIGLVGAALGFGAYKKYTVGELSWKLAGAWAGAVGLFGVADYYLSQ